MRKLGFFVICIAASLCLAGCGGSDLEGGTSPTPEKEESVVVFGYDEVINDFILNYNDVSDSDLTGIDRGNIDIKASGYTHDGYYLNMLHSNATDKIDVEIHKTNDNRKSNMAEMRNVFYDVCRAMDDTLSDSEIYALFDGYIDGSIKGDQSMGSLSVHFSPDIDDYYNGWIGVAVQ